MPPGRPFGIVSLPCPLLDVHAGVRLPLPMRSGLGWPTLPSCQRSRQHHRRFAGPTVERKGPDKVKVSPGLTPTSSASAATATSSSGASARLAAGGMRRVALCRASAAIRAISDSRASNAGSINRSRCFRRPLRSFYPGFHLKLHRWVQYRANNAALVHVTRPIELHHQYVARMLLYLHNLVAPR